MNAWTTGANLPGDGPNAAIAVLDTTNILGGWIGWYPVKQITDWQAGTAADIGDLAGGAVHPWDACVGPDNVYYIKHYNVASQQRGAGQHQQDRHADYHQYCRHAV